MPAAAAPIKMSWIPRGTGKGGTFTNATYHDAESDSTYKVINSYIQHNSWLPQGEYVQLHPLGAVTSLHIFNRYAGITQSITSKIISGVASSPATVYGDNVLVRGGATPMPTTGAGQFCFSTVKNRLYMVNGTDAPAISADATASSCIPWGFAPQAPNLQYQIAASGTGTNAGVLGGSQGTGTVTTLTTLTWVSGVKFDYFQTNAVIYVNGVYNTVAFVNSTTVLTLTFNAVNNVGVPFSYGPTGIIGNANYTGTVPGPALNTLTVWAPPGGLPVFIVGPGPPPMTPTPGSPCYIAGAASPAEPTIKYTLAAVTGANAGAISPVYAEAVGAVTRNTQINFSSITFDNGRAYQYAVSYFNPTSGHVSNTSPVLNVKDGAPNNVNVSITINGIVTTNDANYTKIILWRSAANGSNLFPLAILNNNTGNTVSTLITYTDFLGDDTALGTAAGGPGKLSAPRGENAQPPSDMNFIQYWDGRFWGASQTQIGILFFSARSSPGNAEDISVGVGEECWPPSFTRSIPESDGRITGLRTVANNLFVLTDNNIYAVVGNNAQNYGLSRVSAKGNGTSHFATCVLPAEDTNSSDVLVHFGNDSRLYFLFGSGGDFQISYAVQDQFGGFTAANTIVGLLHAYQTTYIVVSSVGGGGKQFFYDLERKVWFNDNTFVATAYTEGLYGGVLTPLYGNLLGSYQGQILGGIPPGVTVYTNEVSPGGLDKKDDKLLESVTVYYDRQATALTVSAVIDGNTFPCVEVPNTGNYSAYFEKPDARVFIPTAFAGGGAVARGRLFQIIVQINTPLAFADSTREIVGTWSVSQDAIAKGGNL